MFIRCHELTLSLSFSIQVWKSNMPHHFVLLCDIHVNNYVMSPSRDQARCQAVGNGNLQLLLPSYILTQFALEKYLALEVISPFFFLQLHQLETCNWQQHFASRHFPVKKIEKHGEYPSLVSLTPPRFISRIYKSCPSLCTSVSNTYIDYEKIKLINQVSNVHFWHLTYIN